MAHTHKGHFEELVHPDDRQELFIGREQGHPFHMLTRNGSSRYCRGNSRMVSGWYTTTFTEKSSIYW